MMGDTFTDYSYTVMSIDQDNDSIKYIFNWGDGTNITTEYVPNGTAYTETHNWTTPAIYVIKVIAIDEHNATSIPSELLVCIDINYCEEIGYIIDMDGDGIYDLFHCNETDNKIVIEFKNDNYLIDSDGDGNWDYTFNMVSGLSVYQEEEDKGILSLELILVICIIVIFLIAAVVILRKRHKKI